jgi:hypothetical protein
MNHDVTRHSRHTRYFLLLTALGVCACPGALSFGATPSAACAANPESRQLDFWLGEWTIAGADGKPSATSRVHLALGKCMVVESWNGSRGHEGENMFAYSQDDRSWHGMFTDNEGRVHVFVDGRVALGSAVFSGPSRGPNDASLLNRISITRAGPDRVEQLWQKSADNGHTWSTEFRGEYSRRSR